MPLLMKRWCVHHYYRLTFRSFVCPDQRLVSKESLVGAFYANENGFRLSVLQRVCRLGCTVGAFPQGETGH